MNCPKCKTEFDILEHNGIKIQYCKKCKAVWVSFSTLQKLGEMLQLKTKLINLSEMPAVKVKEESRQCPGCTKPLEKVYFNGIIADKCTDCNGILLDNGELSKYFGLFMKQKPPLIDNLTFITRFCLAEKNKHAIEYPEIEIQSKEQEKRVLSIPGFLVLFIMLFIGFFVYLIAFVGQAMWILPVAVTIFAIACMGFKILKPQEALVLTVFGQYIGTLRGAGFHYVNPLAQSVTPFVPISLKAMTLESGKQKINDELGNPIEVGIIVIWEVQDTAKATFNVNNYKTFISAQSDSALRTIVRMYPYDVPENSNLQSLRGDSAEISAKLKAEIQRNVKVAGINVVDAKITHLAYAPEIAAAMLQRQQAAAVVDAKNTIVEGAVGMVEMALNRLSKNNIVQLDELEKAKMVNNLLVILCANKEAQPVIKNNLN